MTIQAFLSFAANRHARAAVAALIVMAIAVLSPAPAPAQGMVNLSQSETADVFRIQAYLNSIRTLSSRFLQVSSDGDYSEGTLLFSKPGKMRLEYDDPNPTLLVSDGVNLAYFDKELQQVSYFDLQATQASILLSDNISFSSGEIIITAFERGPGVFRLTVLKGSDPLEGNMTMIFSDKPLSLKKWTIIDAQGVVTNISLVNPRFGAPVSRKLFDLDAPELNPESQ
jgi:outer membrane lipoprotein-sorting protein